MSRKLTTVLLGLCVLLLAGLLVQRALPSPAAGRYSISATGGGLYFADTRTGRLWIYANDISTDKPRMVWVEIDSPVHKYEPAR